VSQNFREVIQKANLENTNVSQTIMKNWFWHCNGFTIRVFP